MAMNIIGRLNDVALDCRVKRFTENAVHCGAVSSVRFTIRSFFIVGSVRFILSFLVPLRQIKKTEKKKKKKSDKKLDLPLL